MTQYKAAQDSKGNPIMVEMTPEEIAQQQADSIASRNWHNNSKPIRVILSFECLKTLNVKKEFNESIYNIYEYFKSTAIEKYEVSNDLYIYLSEIYPEHQELLESNGAIVENL